MTGVCQVATGFTGGPACAALGSFVSGITSGNLGQALRGAAIAFVTAAAFKVVGDITGEFQGAPNGGHAPLIPGSEAHLFNIAGHALVGCLSAVAGGSRCGPGTLAAGVTSLAGPLVNGEDFSLQGLVANSVLGGVASVAGGGNFANGAVTAAFAYLFNGSARRLTGPGHHMLTNQVASQYDWSAAALGVFDAPIGDGGGRIVVQGHNFGDGHALYNRQVSQFVADYLERTGIDPSKMTTSQAKDLIRAIKFDPVLRPFNTRIFMRGVFQQMRRMPPPRSLD